MTSRSLTHLGISSLLVVALLGCASGKRWVKDGYAAKNNDQGINLMEGSFDHNSSADGQGRPRQPEGAINAPPAPPTEGELADASGARPELKLTGKRGKVAAGPVDGVLLGVFRNTYYDFPSETDHHGSTIHLMDRSCKPISKVPRSFFEAVCVQGSGTLKSGRTVSFAKRDCACAEVCPRTNQKICFDELSAEEFPWGRGAQGTAITPLRSIAVDTSEIPLGTKVYIVEYDGVPRSPGGALHDGCFIAQDRGMKVVGKHVDVFSGNPRATEHLNALVPSNQGVHVYANTARCESMEL